MVIQCPHALLSVVIHPLSIIVCFAHSCRLPLCTQLQVAPLHTAAGCHFAHSCRLPLLLLLNINIFIAGNLSKLPIFFSVKHIKIFVQNFCKFFATEGFLRCL
jgi:hypothetical protein